MKIEGWSPIATLTGLLILSQDSLIFIILGLRLLQEVNLHTFNLDLV
jgi:competence protein ComGF